MQKNEKILKAVMNGEYNDVLISYYGEDKLYDNKMRYEEALTVFGQIYEFKRECRMYTIPYSVLLAGDGADVAIPTDKDFICVAAENGTNVSRIRCRDHLGEDNIDLYAHGPYGMESEFTIGVIRGVQQAFMEKGYRRIQGMDLYIDCDTLPGYGLDEPAHLATAVAYIINDVSFNGERTEKELAEVVQWALANHIMVDSYATDVYASLRGVAVTGDFTDTDNEVITEITVDMTGRNMYVVVIGKTDVDMPEEEVDPRLDAFMAKLGKEIETLTEKEFYEILSEMEEVDKEAALFLMDYFTQENFGEIYAANAVEGMGSPSVETTKEIEKESVGGAVKWHCKTKAPNWMVLCCVAEEAKEAFETAMKKLYGDECLEKLNVARKGAGRVID